MMEGQSFSNFCGGQIWDADRLENNWWPEFTECFQWTFLIWVPCGWLWITLPINLYLIYTRKYADTLPLGCLSVSKTFFALTLVFIELVQFMYDINRSEENNPVSTARLLGSAISGSTFLLAAVLMQLDRIHGVISSGFLFIFWLLTMVAGIVPFYTLIILKRYNDELFTFVLFNVYFAIVLVIFLTSIFAESMQRRQYTYLGKEPSPETQASFLSRVTYWWINKLIIIGYRKGLEEDDLWSLHPRDQSNRVIPQFQRAWDKEVERTKLKRAKYFRTTSTRNKSDHLQESGERTPLLGKQASKSGEKSKKKEGPTPSLLKVLVKTYGGDVLASWGLKMMYDLIQFASPLILNVLIEYVETKNDPVDHTDVYAWKGYVYALAFFLVSIFQSCVYQQSFHVCMTCGMRIKSALIAAVYRKALTMNSDARKSSTVGEIVNLMSVDCQRIQDITGYLYMLWSSPLTIAIALAFLWNTLGPSVLAGLGVMVLMMPGNVLIAVKQRNLQMKLMAFKDQRLKVMNEVLNGIKVLKLYTWEASFQKKVADIRQKELDVLKTNAFLGAVSTLFWTSAPFLVTLASFVTYILTSESHYLDAQTAFVSLSLFNILRFPINMLPMIISFLVQGQVSVVRIRKFLQSEDLDPDIVQNIQQTENAIQVKNGSFSWGRELQPTLTQINVTIPERGLVAVVGQVGAGKSSLISAVLGEMEKIQGQVLVKGRVAYVPQEAWIQNATVRDNILFSKAYNASRYQEVIEACALSHDLEILPGGDLTEIGEKGINLSGGQKQRVSLARAVYNDADIYLLDDPLSAVDSHVGKHIFDKVVGEKGLLRHKTRVLVTHGIHWLPRVDFVIVMVDGQVSECGSYTELLRHNGPFAQFLKTFLTQEDDEDEEEDPEVQRLKSEILQRVDSLTSSTEVKTGHTSTEEDVPGKLKTRKRRQSSKIGDRTLSRQESILLSGKEHHPEQNVDKLIEAEKSESGNVSYRVYIKYFRSMGGVFTTVLMLLFFVMYQGAGIGSNIWLSQWTDDEYLKENTAKANTTEYQNKNNMYLGVYAALGIGQALVMLVFGLFFAVKTIHAANILHGGMLDRILKAPMAFFDTTPVGRIVNRFSRDVETIDNNLPQTLNMFLMMGLGVIATIVVISYSTPIFLTVVLPVGCFYYAVQRFYIPTSRQLKRIESTTRSPIYTHFSESVTGASTIRAYGMTDRFMEESRNRVDKNLVFYFAGIASNRWLGFRLEFIGSFFVLAAAIFSVVSDSTTGGLVGLSVSYALQITQVLNWLVRMTSDLETNIVSVERVKEYSEVETEASWIMPFNRPPHDWPSKGDVELDKYSTRYRDGLDLVLRGITCSINGGERVGIVGRTGAGKSSLTLALFRIIESAGGQILVDGRSIANMGLHDLRSKLTILPQDPVLFSGTLKMNLDPFGMYTENRLWDALEKAHLKSFVTSQSDGLQHECGEGGQNLSVGQRQLVCLARTLLRKTKILILDEATAAVDMETDDLIQKTIRHEFAGCTILTIAHRLNTIMDYDRILVLEEGRVREFDTPSNLLKDKASVFYSMAKDANLVTS